jgi:homoserine O-acetyltransferase
MGGMLAMEWSDFGKQYVRSLALISTAARQSAWAIAGAENQRSTIMSDARYRGGNYAHDPPVNGLGAARMAAMMSYRTHSSFEKRFGRCRQDSVSSVDTNGTRRSIDPGRRSILDEKHRDESGEFSAQSYLRYQGDKINARFDPNCYLHILDQLDSHDITRGRCSNLTDGEAMKKVLGQIRQRALVISIPSDGLYPISEQVALCENMPNATFASLESDDGHDGFLLEGGQVNDLLDWFSNKEVVVEVKPQQAECGVFPGLILESEIIANGFFM